MVDIGLPWMHLILDHQEKNLMGDLPPSNDDGNDRDEKASKDPPKDCSSPSWLVKDEQQRGQHLGLRVAMVIMVVKMALMFITKNGRDDKQ